MKVNEPGFSQVIYELFTSLMSAIVYAHLFNAKEIPSVLKYNLLKHPIRQQCFCKLFQPPPPPLLSPPPPSYKVNLQGC